MPSIGCHVHVHALVASQTPASVYVMAVPAPNCGTCLICDLDSSPGGANHEEPGLYQHSDPEVRSHQC